MSFRYNEKGFTLIELILTITMLGILSIGLLSFFLYGYKYISMAGEKSKTVFENQEDTEALIASRNPTGTNETITISFGQPTSISINVNGIRTTKGSLVNFLPGLTTSTIPVTGISITPSTLTLPYIGSSGSITASILPSNATNNHIIWHTSDASIVTVIGGLVEAIGPGTAIITAETEEGNYTDSTTITVDNAIMSSDATLSDLTVGGVTISGFDPNVFNYTSKGNGNPEEVSGTVNDAGATMFESVKAKNRNKDNITRIIVIAADGTKNTYEVTFLDDKKPK